MLNGFGLKSEFYYDYNESIEEKLRKCERGYVIKLNT